MLILSYREKAELLLSTIVLFILLFFIYGQIPSIFVEKIPNEISNKNIINIIIVTFLYFCWYLLTKFGTNYFVFDS